MAVHRAYPARSQDTPSCRAFRMTTFLWFVTWAKKSHCQSHRWKGSSFVRLGS